MLSRFCVFWIKKTIRNVTMVVPVLMISCHVSEKRKIGPVTAQARITEVATMNAQTDPTRSDTVFANFLNTSVIKTISTASGVGAS